MSQALCLTPTQEEDGQGNRCCTKDYFVSDEISTATPSSHRSPLACVIVVRLSWQKIFLLLAVEVLCLQNHLSSRHIEMVGSSVCRQLPCWQIHTQGKTKNITSLDHTHTQGAKATGVLEIRGNDDLKTRIIILLYSHLTAKRNKSHYYKTTVEWGWHFHLQWIDF